MYPLNPPLASPVSNLEELGLLVAEEEIVLVAASILQRNSETPLH